MDQLNNMLEAGFAAPCPSMLFCTECRCVVCHNCCGDDHLVRHHGGVGDVVTVPKTGVSFTFFSFSSKITADFFLAAEFLLRPSCS